MCKEHNPADALGITEEMIAAGVLSLEESLGDYLPPDWPRSPYVVRNVLIAALGAAPKYLGID